MTSLPPQDLSTALGRPDRAAGLRLPAKKAPAPAPDPDTGQERQESPGTQAPAHAPAPAAAGAPHPAPGQHRAILVLWTPESIRARMRAVRATKETPFIDIVLDAIEATVDQLPDLVVKQAQPQTVHGRLFDRVQAAAGQPETKVQVTIRGALPSHLAVIDDLVKTTGAPNRSALITLALDQALPARPRAQR